MLTPLYRFVGGFMTQDGTFKTRLVFSSIAAAYVAFAMIVKGFGWDDACTVLVTSFALTYVGRMIPHGWAWQKGVIGYVYLSIISFIRVGLWLSPAFYYMPELTPLCSLGLLSGTAYALGKNVLDDVDCGIYHVKNATFVKYNESPLWAIESKNEPSVFAKGWTEWGEVLTGLLCYDLAYMLLLAL